MLKFSILILFFLTLSLPVFSATLNKIRAGYYPQIIRIAFDFDGAVSYTAEASSDRINVRLISVEAGADVPNYFEINDPVLVYLQTEKEGDDLKITIPLKEPLGWRIFPLADPPRLVVDFGKEFTHMVSGGTVCEGAEYIKVKKQASAGLVLAHVLKVKSGAIEVFPALAREGEGVFESLVGFFNPWKKEKRRRFYKARVSEIAAQNGGVGGINGGFFASNGAPLGTLMIERALLSSPIHDRTALVITEDGSAYIDNIMVDSFFRLASGVKYKITGVNQWRGKADTILYTKIWGERTAASNSGVELVVEDNEIKVIKAGNAQIPENGYVISVAGPGVEHLWGQVKVGDHIEISNNVIPYSIDPQKILHIISGGPRLLKDGNLYVSKYGERFRGDVARGRAARSAAAVTKDGDLLLVAVDGRPRGRKNSKKAGSIGMTLEGLAHFLLELGAVEAVNLDGGSSTAMVMNGRVVNQPAGGTEKRVSNAVVIRPRTIE